MYDVLIVLTQMLHTEIVDIGRYGKDPFYWIIVSFNRLI